MVNPSKSFLNTPLITYFTVMNTTCTCKIHSSITLTEELLPVNYPPSNLDQPSNSNNLDYPGNLDLHDYSKPQTRVNLSLTFPMEVLWRLIQIPCQEFLDPMCNQPRQTKSEAKEYFLLVYYMTKKMADIDLVNSLMIPLNRKMADIDLVKLLTIPLNWINTLNFSWIDTTKTLSKSSDSEVNSDHIGTISKSSLYFTKLQTRPLSFTVKPVS